MILYGMKGRRRLHGRRDRDSVYYPKIKSHQQAHLLQKPETLIEFLIGKSSNPGDVVLDPFAGSGTVGACCVRGGRSSIQFEIDLRYKRSLVGRMKREIKLSGMAQSLVVE
jgi:DNA modification methylase